MPRLVSLLSAFGVAALLSVVTLPHPASAAPDNTSGMALMGVRVFADGTFTNASGVTGVTKVTTGEYRVAFDRDIAACVYTATIMANIGHIEAQLFLGTVRVLTTTADGSGSVNSAFHLMVFCSK